MKTIFAICSMLLLNFGFSQSSVSTLTFKDFGWTVSLPSGYAAAKPDSSDDETRFLFRYEKDPAHYIEAYSESFDEKTDGNYREAASSAKKEAADIANQMLPGSATVSESETVISGLAFLTYTTRIIADADFSLYTKTFTRLFGSRTLTINVIYADENEGNRLTEAVKQSVFRK